MPRGGHRPGAGRPPGARNKPKPPRVTAAKRAAAKKLDALQIVMDAARELHARGEIIEAGKMAARAMPYTLNRFGPSDETAKRSPEQQLAFDFAPAAKAPGEPESPDDFDGLLN